MTSDSAGKYVAADLRSGRYRLRVESPGFRVGVRDGIVLQEGNCELVNVSLRLDIGSSEMVAVSMRAEEPPPENLHFKKKPLNYVVGDREGDTTFQGIAKLVYGNPKAWVQIFEANRSVLLVPGPIPYGTAIYVPPRKHVIPKLISKVAPIYPGSGAPGDVLLDVTLAADGTVKWVGVIDGNPALAQAAVNAVKQWRYRPLVVKGKAVDQFVVLVSFGKDGKVK